MIQFFCRVDGVDIYQEREARNIRAAAYIRAELEGACIAVGGVLIAKRDGQEIDVPPPTPSPTRASGTRSTLRGNRTVYAERKHWHRY